MKKVLAYALLTLASSLNARSGGPNIVFIMMDDLGYSQVEAYARGLDLADCDPKLLAHVEERGGYTPEQAFEMVKRATPTLSRMADQGIRFNNAFASSNLCASARIGVATGILQNRWGIYRNIDAEAHGLKPHSHLAELLQERGYATAHIGKWHVGSRDRDMVQRYLERAGIKHGGELTYSEVRSEYPEIAKQLEGDGYEGSVVQRDHPLNNGFDYYFGYNMWQSPFYDATNVWENSTSAGLIREYNTDVFTRKALDFMSKSIAAGKPFYVQLYYHAVHEPLAPMAPDKYIGRFDSDSRMLNNFYAHIFGIDENVRIIEEFLTQHGEDTNTIFVFTSDNGGSVGNNSCLPGNAPYVGHKGMLHMGGFRVPLFFYWPEGIPESGVNNQLVSTMDILPTLVEIAGGKCPDGLDGKSLARQIMEGREDPVRSHLAIGGIHARVWGFNGATSFFTHNESRKRAPSGYIVADNRYIMRYVSETMPNLYKDAVDGLPSSYVLYDYRDDPGETNNIADAHPEKVQQLREIWKRESANYPAPVSWGIDKWQAIMDAD